MELAKSSGVDHRSEFEPWKRVDQPRKTCNNVDLTIPNLRLNVICWISYLSLLIWQSCNKFSTIPTWFDNPKFDNPKTIDWLGCMIVDGISQFENHQQSQNNSWISYIFSVIFSSQEARDSEGVVQLDFLLQAGLMAGEIRKTLGYGGNHQQKKGDIVGI